MFYNKVIFKQNNIRLLISFLNCVIYILLLGYQDCNGIFKLAPNGHRVIAQITLYIENFYYFLYNSRSLVKIVNIIRANPI